MGDPALTDRLGIDFGGQKGGIDSGPIWEYRMVC